MHLCRPRLTVDIRQSSVELMPLVTSAEALRSTSFRSEDVGVS